MILPREKPIIEQVEMETEMLETELAFFEKHRKEWLGHHEGKFALIKGEKLLGIYDTDDAAYRAGIELLGNVDMLIKEVLPEDFVDQIPALMSGLINASF